MADSSPDRLTPLAKAIVALGRSTPLGRGRARHALTNLLERLHKGAIRSDYRGVPFELHLDNATERKALFGRYNDEELDFLASALRGAESQFVDVGANAGFFTQIIAATTPAHVLAIEPNPEMLARLEANLALLGREARGRVDIERVAIGAAPGRAHLSLDRGFGEAHLVDARAAHTIEVDVVPLYDIIRAAGLRRIDALKIDIEGFEDQALGPFLASAPPALWPGVIVIEFTSAPLWRSDLFVLLASCGYAEVQRTRGNALLRRVPLNPAE